jgi:hypothetical protein
MENDREILDSILEIIRGDGEFWFSLKEQKKLAFMVAKELLVADPELEAGEAITLAKEFIDEFLDRVIKQGSWERN